MTGAISDINPVSWWGAVLLSTHCQAKLKKRFTDETETESINYQASNWHLATTKLKTEGNTRSEKLRSSRKMYTHLHNFKK